MSGNASVLGTAPLDALDAYRTCEFVTLAKDGTPLVWPTAVRRRPDGTLLLSTSLAFAQKALNIRRDGRVALLFSDPTGSGLAHAPEVFVGGLAECPEEVMAGPEGAEDYWRTLFERQPHSRAYVSAPLRRLMSWYYLRLLITVTADRVVVREPFVPPARPPGIGGSTLVGAGQLADYPSAVLAARDASGAPVLARTLPVPADGGFSVRVPDDCAAAPGPASLLVHRHDEKLGGIRNALVRGELTAAGEDGTRLLVPERVVEPMGSGRPSEAFRFLGRMQRATDRYLERRELPRPPVRWPEFKRLAAETRKS